MSHNQLFVYGTSGFRTEAILLPDVVRRTAFYAAIRACTLKKTVGIMITASHNPAQDNGIKLVDPEGQMLPMEFEEELTALVNSNEEQFARYKEEALKRLACGDMMKRKCAAVVLATDTRPSSPLLLSEALAGIGPVGKRVLIEIYMRHTTPQLHFIVRSSNFPAFTMNGNYLGRFRTAFAEAFEALSLDSSRSTNCCTKELFIDCANGVGALWIGDCLGLTSNGSSVLGRIEAKLLNTDTQSHSLLNHQCGADFVKISARFPANFENVPLGARCASLDGDADRLVYFFPEIADGTVRLLDGDHIAALFCRFIKQMFDSAFAANKLGQPIPLTFGVVQTAYANGNSTRYFRQTLGIEPILAKTGVKHLEKKARQFDIGVYFEANGHGTVCFSHKFHAYLENFDQAKSSEWPRHVLLLSLFSRLVNEVVGDGIADLLAVEYLLQLFDWSIQKWEQETYRNIPSLQLKIPVEDRSLFVTEEERETVLVLPDGLQERIDSVVANFGNARAFIRPSGTEQIVRVYAEAETEEQVQELARQLAQLIN